MRCMPQHLLQLCSHAELQEQSHHARTTTDPISEHTFSPQHHLTILSQEVTHRLARAEEGVVR